jgi:hypothetical protein
MQIYKIKWFCTLELVLVESMQGQFKLYLRCGLTKEMN